MRNHAIVNRATVGLLCLGVAVPILYYGVQVAAAPYFPGFSILANTASDLGSDRSENPAFFNAGLVLTAGAMFGASVGILVALVRLHANKILAAIAFSTVAMTGVGTLVAGLFPLPDPRHAGYPAFLVFTLAVPFAMAAALWKLGISRPVKAYFAATIVLLLIMVPVMTGATTIDMGAYAGICQRVFALTVFPPIAVGAALIIARVNAASSIRQAQLALAVNSRAEG